MNKTLIALALVNEYLKLLDKEIKDYSLYFPTLDEQIAIANLLVAIDKEVALYCQDLEQEKRKKKALMQLLLTGIVRVRGVESGVAKRLPADCNLLASGKQIRKERAKCRRIYQ